MADLASQAWAVIERLFDRLGTKSARGLDVDATVILTQQADEIERLRTALERMKRTAESMGPNGQPLGAGGVGMNWYEWMLESATAALDTSLNEHGDVETCHADRDGDCSHAGCPQIRDGEPHKSGRHCPLDFDCERCGENWGYCICPGGPTPPTSVEGTPE